MNNNMHSNFAAVAVKSIEYSICLSFLMVTARSMVFALRFTIIAATHNSTQLATTFVVATVATELRLLVTNRFPLWSTAFIDL